MEDEHEALVEGEGEAAGQVDEMAETVAELQRIVAERDAALVRLREEATARQRRLSELEDALDRKTAQLIHTQRLQVERREAAAEAAAEAATPLLAREGADDGAAAKPLGSLSRCSSDGSSGAGTGLAALAPAHRHSSDGSSGTGGTGGGTGTTPLARRSLAAVGPTGTPLELTEPQEGWGGISETSRRLEVELEAAQRQLQAASETAASAEDEVETMRAGLAAAHDAAAVQGEALRVEREKAAAAREAQQRERAVLVSLLECKVSRLLAHVSHDLEPPVDEARRQRASQEVQALRRLVAAAVVALQMPDG
uniref:Uncharacterized protein n=1 Tax=Emiliania huxleyi TaxID=2903 RepID=A0A6V2NLF0_EMIHU